MFIINIISSAATHVLRLTITAGVAFRFRHFSASQMLIFDGVGLLIDLWSLAGSKKSDTIANPPPLRKFLLFLLFGFTDFPHARQFKQV